VQLTERDLDLLQLSVALEQPRLGGIAERGITAPW
jgi:hypothetical protein